MVVAKDNNQLGGSTKQKVDISLNYPSRSRSSGAASR
jgi:hypothetical protein